MLNDDSKLIVSSMCDGYAVSRSVAEYALHQMRGDTIRRMRAGHHGDAYRIIDAHNRARDKYETARRMLIGLVMVPITAEFATSLILLRGTPSEWAEKHGVTTQEARAAYRYLFNALRKYARPYATARACAPVAAQDVFNSLFNL